MEFRRGLFRSEARVNEYMARDVNPNVPFTPDEIAEAAAACREAGASILHYHARNADGSPNHDPDAYLETIAKHRAATDILRSEERRVGKECVSTCSSRWWLYH